MSSPAESQLNAEYFQAVVPGVSGAINEKGMCHFKNFTNVASDTENMHPDTTIVELFSTQDCWVLLKESDSASVAAIPAQSTKTFSKFIPGGITAFIGVPKKEGKRYKFSVIRDANSGTLYVTEGA